MIFLKDMRQRFQMWIVTHLNLVVFILFVILTIIAGWSVITQLDAVIIGNDDDVYINPWADWWTLKAWQDPNIEFWKTDYLFYPHGTNLAYHSFSHLNTIISLGLRPFMGVLPAYNITVLFNFVLAGFAMFQFARYLTRSSVASILAGVVFAFNPHALYQSSHPVLVSIWCFPWATFFFIRAIRENKIKWAVVAAIFVFLGAATSTILIILLAVWFIFFIVFIFFDRQWPRPTWHAVTILGLLSLVFTLPLVNPLLIEAFAKNNASFWIDPYTTLNADIFSFFIPHWYIWTKRGLYLGILPLYLLMLAFQFQRRKARMWLILIIMSYLFAIGPRPEFMGSQLGITLPWSLLITPVLRNTYRVNILMSLGLAMVVAYGWIALSSQLKTKRARSIALIVVFAAIYGEYNINPFPHVRPDISSFYTAFMRDVPDDMALATLPTGRQVDKKYLYYQTIHEHKIVGGVVSRPSENVYDFIYEHPLLRAGVVDLEPKPIPEDAARHLQTLADENVGYLVLDKTLMDVNEWRAALPLSPVFEDELVLVYSTGIPR
ncbi:MAG: YfhO family protein [Chloroflexi bacterium]|nr:YfhO family protein [Chloroflexota bacterium]